MIVAPTWQQIVQVEKVVSTKRIRVAEDNGSYRLRARIDANIVGNLAVAIRVSSFLVERFSLVLTYRAPDCPETAILRLNGPHGPHRNRHDGGKIITGPHLHVAVPGQENDSPDSEFVAEHGLELPPEYVSLPRAWEHFRELVNLAPHPGLARHIGRFYADGAQQEFEGFDDPNDD